MKYSRKPTGLARALSVIAGLFVLSGVVCLWYLGVPEISQNPLWIIPILSIGVYAVSSGLFAGIRKIVREKRGECVCWRCGEYPPEETGLR